MYIYIYIYTHTYYTISSPTMIFKNNLTFNPPNVYFTPLARYLAQEIKGCSESIVGGIEAKSPYVNNNTNKHNTINTTTMNDKHNHNDNIIVILVLIINHYCRGRQHLG